MIQKIRIKQHRIEDDDDDGGGSDDDDNDVDDDDEIVIGFPVVYLFFCIMVLIYNVERCLSLNLPMPASHIIELWACITMSDIKVLKDIRKNYTCFTEKK